MIVTVRLEGRRFLVTFDEAGEPQIIKERKIHAPGTYMAAWYNAPYWHKSHRIPAKPGSMVSKVLAEAKAAVSTAAATQ